jgi:sulfite exporter TauE/SafE
MMKIEFVKDGAIQGWVVSFAFTVMTMILLLVGFFNQTVMNGWKALGGNYSTIYLGSMGIWLGYRGLKSYTEFNYRKYDEGNIQGGSAKFPL